MKIPKFHFNNKHTDVTLSRHKLSHRIWRDPYTDWVIVIIVSGLLSLYLAFLGINSYLTVDEKIDEAARLSSTAAPVSIDTKPLTRVLDRFNAREAERNVLLRSYAGIPDPSL